MARRYFDKEQRKRLPPSIRTALVGATVFPFGIAAMVLLTLDGIGVVHAQTVQGAGTIEGLLLGNLERLLVFVASVGVSWGVMLMKVASLQRDMAPKGELALVDQRVLANTAAIAATMEIVRELTKEVHLLAVEVARVAAISSQPPPTPHRGQSPR